MLTWIALSICRKSARRSACRTERCRTAARTSSGCHRSGTSFCGECTWSDGYSWNQTGMRRQSLRLRHVTDFGSSVVSPSNIKCCSTKCHPQHCAGTSAMRASEAGCAGSLRTPYLRQPPRGMLPLGLGRRLWPPALHDLAHLARRAVNRSIMRHGIQRVIVVALLGALIGLSSHPVRAQTAPLASGERLTLPSLRPLAKSDLAGDAVVTSKLYSFVIRDRVGSVTCRGRIESRILRSDETNRLQLHYRIRDTSGTGSIKQISVAGLANLPVQVGWMNDPAGTAAPTRAVRSRDPGNVIEFSFAGVSLPCRSHKGSHFVVVATSAGNFKGASYVRILMTNGYGASIRTQP